MKHISHKFTGPEHCFVITVRAQTSGILSLTHILRRCQRVHLTMTRGECGRGSDVVKELFVTFAADIPAYVRCTLVDARCLHQGNTYGRPRKFCFREGRRDKIFKELSAGVRDKRHEPPEYRYGKSQEDFAPT